MKAEYIHAPVMVQEVLEVLKVRPGGKYVDATVGEGGHSQAILEASQPPGQVLGLDADESALDAAAERLARFGEAFRPVLGNYSELAEICLSHQFTPVNGILFDLGLSSNQLAQGHRGFSFQVEGPLDMRFGKGQKLTAGEIVNRWPELDLEQILRDYGEEPKARRIAKAIVSDRPITTTKKLAAVIEKVVGSKRGRIHPATRTFQALRIAVNQELEALKKALEQTIGLLVSGGRLAVITYHSLEARVFKEFIRRESRDCICPPGALGCCCGHRATFKQTPKKAIAPSRQEVEANPRSRSARLRVGEHL